MSKKETKNEQLAFEYGDRIRAAIDSGSLRSVQWRVIILCAFVAIIDGFDAQAIAFAAPDIAKEYSTSPAQLGRLFSSALVGLMVGAFAMGPAADRFGRKPVIVVSCALMGVFSLAVAFAGSIEQLMLYRFLTGLGLGGAMPNVNVLTSEYAPARSRAFWMTVMFAGFPLGAVAGGFASTALIVEFGWRSIFVVGGVVPLILVPVLLFFLPESPHIISHDGSSSIRLKRLAAQLGVSLAIGATANSEMQRDGVTHRRGRFMDLFGKRTGLTLAVWSVFLLNLLIVYTLMNWLPTVMKTAGLSLQTAIYTGVVFNAGGVIGGILIAMLIDRGGAKRTLAIIFAMGAGATSLIAPSISIVPLLFIAIFFAGWAFVGSQFGLNALVTRLYPDAVRSTGLAWALAAGRIGAIIGPIATGEFIARDWSLTAVFISIASLSIICSITVILLPIRRELHHDAAKT